MVSEKKASSKDMNKGSEEAKEHAGALKRLEEKDPEFYEFLKEHDKQLLEFDEVERDDSVQTDVDEEEEEEEEEKIDDDDDDDGIIDSRSSKEKRQVKKVITGAMVDAWCGAIKDGAKIGAVRSVLRAFHSACHYGDEGEADDSSAKFSTMSSNVFNKIMLFVLKEMDGILRGLLDLPSSGGKKETIVDIMATKKWKNYSHLVKSYLGNSLHVLNQLTDSEMTAFMLRRLKYSCIFLAAFPVLLRKYIKVALHFWGTGNGALPVVSFLFMRDICIRLGPKCLDDCIKGMYKGFIMNCQFVNAANMQHLQFLSNCFTELLGIDIPSAYQHAFAYIRQLAMILKEALSGSTKKKSTNGGKDEPKPSGSKKQKGKNASSGSSQKEAFRKVYRWKYVYCLELWTGVVSRYSSEPDLAPLAYPLVQIITGVAQLVPSTCYIPLRLRCVRMLNRIGAATGTFIPVSLLLLSMLDIKELNRTPTGGVGNPLDLFSILKVSKGTIKTRAFQEGCVFSVVEELAEHISQWSSSIAFMELTFIPSVRLRNFCKSTKVDRFRREIKNLIHQIELNSDYVNVKRSAVSFLPNSPAAAAASFLEDDRKSGKTPMSQYAAVLRQRAQERNDSLRESSVLVGETSSKFESKLTAREAEDNDDEVENEAAPPRFSLPPKHDSRSEKKKIGPLDGASQDEDDVIEDFVLSSDEDDDDEGNDEPEVVTHQQQQQQPKKKAFFNSKKRKRGKPPRR